MNASTYTPESIRPAQLGYLNALLNDASILLHRREEVTGCEWPEAHAHVARIRSNADALTKREASAAISEAIKNNALLTEELKGLGALEEPVRRPAREQHEFVTTGMYQLNGRIFKVLPSRNSDRHYAKELTGESATGYTFVYAKGAMSILTAEHKMTAEQAAEFGKLTGSCCCCGKLLTDPESVAKGIGPVCEKKYF